MYLNLDLEGPDGLLFRDRIRAAPIRPSQASPGTMVRRGAFAVLAPEFLRLLSADYRRDLQQHE